MNKAHTKTKRNENKLDLESNICKKVSFQSDEMYVPLRKQEWHIIPQPHKMQSSAEKNYLKSNQQSKILKREETKDL